MKRSIIVSSAIFFSAAGLLLVGQAPTLPGTSVDRIGFPKDYRTTFKQMYVFDNDANRQVRVVWANDIAQTADPTQPVNFPYGSILLFESYPAVLDSDGNPTLDENGRFQRGNLTTVFAMKKDHGFGTEYGPIRNGEWEYVSYTPDGTTATAPANSGACALCHLQGSSAPLALGLPPLNAVNDYVFRASTYFNKGSGALPGAVMLNYSFVPKTIHVKAGSTLTLYNDDQLVHNIIADDGSFGSDYLGTNGSFSVKFDQPGTVPIHCSLHPRMKATIIVDPPDSAAAAVLNYSHSGAQR
jgi:plastocyanin